MRQQFHNTAVSRKIGKFFFTKLRSLAWKFSFKKNCHLSEYISNLVNYIFYFGTCHIVKMRPMSNDRNMSTKIVSCCCCCCYLPDPKGLRKVCHKVCYANCLSYLYKHFLADINNWNRDQSWWSKSSKYAHTFKLLICVTAWPCSQDTIQTHICPNVKSNLTNK
mgnify:CR=1 FL=1